MKPRIQIRHTRGISSVTHYWWRLLNGDEIIAAEVINHQNEAAAIGAAVRAKKLMAEAEIEK